MAAETDIPSKKTENKTVNSFHGIIIPLLVCILAVVTMLITVMIIDITSDLRHWLSLLLVVLSGFILYAVINSILARRMVFEPLIQAREHAWLMLDSAPLSCNLWKKDITLSDCNDKAVEMFQLRDRQEFMDRFFELSPRYQDDGQDSVKKAAACLKEAFETGRCVFEWKHQLLDGTPIPSEVTLVRVGCGDDMRVAGYMRDLREHKKMMKEIEQRDVLLRTINQAASMLLNAESDDFDDSLHNVMNMMAFAVDADRVYIWKNHVFRDELCTTQIYEWSGRAAPTQGNEYSVNISYDKIIPEWKEFFLNEQCINSLTRDMSSSSREFLSFAGVLAVFIAPVFLRDEFWGFVGFDNCHSETTFTINEEFILRSGCLLIAHAFFRHNNVLEIINLQTDLQNALKEAQMASQAKSNFLASMSHEIRTPMNSIMGFSELALENEISAKSRDYLEKIRKNGEWLLQIINDILDISKIEAGKMELEKIPFDLHELIISCRTLILPIAVEKGLVLHFYAEPSVGQITLGDPTRLRQVLVNLLSNAIKFTNTGIIKLNTSVTAKTGKNITIYFEVKDSGIGIMPGQIARIFEPFSQAESGTTRKYGGTGLGLSITKNIVEMMGGKLGVESAVGIGSRFYFSLNFNTVNDTGDVLKNMAFNEPDKPLFSGEILLAEDNPMNQQVICEHLARIGLKTVIAGNGRICVEKVQDRMEKGGKQFDLIFMDIHMPEMDGIEASVKIKELNAGIPIVAMTANIMTADMEIYKNSGINDCVGKPFTSPELWRCLLKYLTPVNRQSADGSSQSQAERELRQRIVNTFVKDNQNRFKELKEALETGDIKLAFRLAHSLKGNAGQLGKAVLQQAAGDIEKNLKNGTNRVTEAQLRTLEAELGAVLVQLTAELGSDDFRAEEQDESAHEKPDALSCLEFIEKLERRLDAGDSGCRELLSGIRRLPGDETLKDRLIQQMEDFDFLKALATLIELKKKM